MVENPLGNLRTGFFLSRTKIYHRKPFYATFKSTKAAPRGNGAQTPAKVLAVANDRKLLKILSHFPAEYGILDSTKSPYGGSADRMSLIFRIENDRAAMKAYEFGGKLNSEPARVSEQMTLYQNMTEQRQEA